MRNLKLISLTALLLVALPIVAWGDDVLPKVPATPAAVTDLVYARPFGLNQGFEFVWRKEKPTVSEGYLLVLKVDPALVYPRQCPMPILYVGNQTAEPVNIGYESGQLVVIVPGKLSELDLSKSPMWFGTPGLGEQVDAGKIAAERAKADKAGIKPFSAAKLAAAQQKGGAKLAVADRDQLEQALAPVVQHYSPQEANLIEDLQAPRGQ